MDENMKQRLQAVLASYGADPARWPRADRDALKHFLDHAGDDLTEAAAIDRMLDLAPAPPVPAGLETRMLSRLNRDVRTTVVPFARPASKRAPSWPWAAVPLAASLALGIYLGAAGDLDGILPQAVTGDLAAGDDDPSGVDAATDYSGDVLS